MNYTRNILSSGTIRNTPKKVISFILEKIDAKPDQTILEFGPGNGGISFSILNKLQSLPPKEFIAFELSEEFSAGLKKKIKMTIITANAFDYKSYLPDDFKADIILCGLPLSYFPKQQMVGFLKSLQEFKKPDGKILILYHAPWLTKTIKSIYPKHEIQSYFSIPPFFLVTA